VAAELSKQGIYVHLDNHMSKGAWCCGNGDGNAWFGDTDFNTANWKRGLQFMANHVRYDISLYLNLRLISAAQRQRAGQAWSLLAFVTSSASHPKPDHL
jgi:hypothetical protein